MKEIYYLNLDKLPTIPVPHDCSIDKITIENQYITFIFEQDVSYHDSIKYIKPDSKSLVIKYHLVDEFFNIYKWCKPVKAFADKGYYKRIDSLELNELFLSKERVEYLNHYVSYQFLIIELFSLELIRLELAVDFVEFYWG